MSYRKEAVELCIKQKKYKLQRLLNTLNEDEKSKLALSANLQHICSTNGFIKGLDLLIEKLQLTQLELNCLDCDGYTCLHLAASNGHEQTCVYLLTYGADPNAKDHEEQTPLHLCAINGKYKVCKILMEYCNVNCKDCYGATPIHYAAQGCTEESSDFYHTLNQLLSHKKLDINCKDTDGRTALIWAASAGAIPAVKRLIQDGVSVSIPDNQSLTALHCAASNGFSDLVDYLTIEGYANLNQMDMFGCTPLFYSVTRGHMESTIRLIILGADLDHQDYKGRSVGHCAAANGFTSLLQELESHGANLWIKNHKLEYPVHEALHNNHIETVFHLLDRADNSINIHSPTKSGLTLLHMASMSGSLSLVSYLIDRHADVTAIYSNQKGGEYTALDISNEKGFEEISKFLKRSGTRSARQTRSAGHERRVSITVHEPPDQNTIQKKEKPVKLPQPCNHTEPSQLLPNQSNQTISLSQPTNTLTNNDKIENRQSHCETSPRNRRSERSGDSGSDKSPYNDSAPNLRVRCKTSVVPRSSNYSSRDSSSNGFLPRDKNHSLQDSPEGPHIDDSSHRPQTSRNPLERSRLPYSEQKDGGWATSFVNVNSTVKKPRGESATSRSTRPTSAPTANQPIKSKVRDSVANYDTIRQVARKIHDGYNRRPRPRTVRPHTANHYNGTFKPVIKRTSDNTSDSGDQKKDEKEELKYTVVATRGGFTKIREPQQHPTQNKSKTLQKLQQANGNNVLYIRINDGKSNETVGFTQGYDGSLRLRQGLQVSLPNINK